MNSVISPDLKQNKTYEYTARLERQLIPNVAVSVGYVYHKVDNLYTNIQYSAAVRHVGSGDTGDAVPGSPTAIRSRFTPIPRRRSARHSTC